MKPSKTLFIGLKSLLLISAAIISSCVYAEVVVVVSANSSLTQLRSEQIASIFLGKANSFENGSSALPVDLPEGDETREEFYYKFTNKSPAQLSAYWTRNIFTGIGFPPKQLINAEAVQNYIANNPFAIGYIERSLVDSRVKIIRIH